MWSALAAEMGPALGSFLPKAIMAVICGGVIGIEREMRQKPAGFRTNILICVGSTLFMWMSIHIGTQIVADRGDPGRIAAQVVVGIGFLGAGTILHSRGHITGLTSAALIWVVAAIGMAIGAGLHAIAAFTTILILVVQIVFGLLERNLFGRCILRECEVAFDDDRGYTRKEIEKIFRAQGQAFEPTSLKRAGDHMVLAVQCCVVHPPHKKALSSLWKIEGVREVRFLP